MPRPYANIHKFGGTILLMITVCSYPSTAAHTADTGGPPRIKRAIIVDDLLFDFNESVIRPSAKPILDRLAKYLIENPELRLRFHLAGHTDSEEKNDKKLSADRVDSVTQYLKGKGKERGIDLWPKKRNAHGKSKPIASNETEKGRAQNRRVEIFVEMELRK